MHDAGEFFQFRRQDRPARFGAQFRPNAYADADATPPPASTPTPSSAAPSSDPADPATGPPTTGSSFSGGSASACPGPSPAPNIAPFTQPLDVAADVSSSQNVDLLNDGLSVYSKTGGLLQPHESLYQFWCGQPGASGHTLPACSAGSSTNQVSLADTQIAFDPFKSRWVASTMVATIDPLAMVQVHDLLFAISTSSSALDGTGAWERYDIPVCTGQNQKFSDQPILGYSSDWVAVDTICLNSSLANGPDALMLVPQSEIASPPQTLNPTIIEPPLFASRPARDFSGAANPYSQLVLASSQFDPTGRAAARLHRQIVELHDQRDRSKPD